jgi:hypothetical protein
MPQATIHVLPRPYQASIENGLLSRSGSVLAELLPNASGVFVVTVRQFASAGDRNSSPL